MQFAPDCTLSGDIGLVIQGGRKQNNFHILECWWLTGVKKIKNKDGTGMLVRPVERKLNRDNMSCDVTKIIVSSSPKRTDAKFSFSVNIKASSG